MGGYLRFPWFFFGGGGVEAIWSDFSCHDWHGKSLMSLDDSSEWDLGVLVLFHSKSWVWKSNLDLHPCIGCVRANINKYIYIYYIYLQNKYIYIIYIYIYIYRMILEGRSLTSWRHDQNLLKNMGEEARFVEVPSLKLTVCTWKLMVGILVSIWGPAYFQGRTVSFRECRCLINIGMLEPVPKVSPRLGFSNFRRKPSRIDVKFFHFTEFLLALR